MEDPLLSLEVEFIPVEVSVFRKGLCVAEDLAVALAEKRSTAFSGISGKTTACSPAS